MSRWEVDSLNLLVYPGKTFHRNCSLICCFRFSDRQLSHQHTSSLCFSINLLCSSKRENRLKDHFFFNDLKKNFEPPFRIRDRLLHLRNLKKAMHVIFRSTLIFKFLPIYKKMWLLKSMFWDSTVIPTSWSQPAWDWRVKKIPANKALNLRLVLENALSICKTFYDIGSLAFSRRWDKI